MPMLENARAARFIATLSTTLYKPHHEEHDLERIDKNQQGGSVSKSEAQKLWTDIAAQLSTCRNDLAAIDDSEKQRSTS
jgi:hypothetical protein